MAAREAAAHRASHASGASAAATQLQLTSQQASALFTQLENFLSIESFDR